MIVAMVQIEKSIGGKMMERQFSFVVSTPSIKNALMGPFHTKDKKSHAANPNHFCQGRVSDYSNSSRVETTVIIV